MHSQELHGVAHVASRDDLAFAIPYQAEEGQQLRTDAHDSIRWLIRAARIHHRDTAIVCCESQCVTARRKSAAMNPSSRVVQIFSAHSVEWQPFSPYTSFRPFVHALDEA